MRNFVSTLVMLFSISPLFAASDLSTTLKTAALGYPYTQAFVVNVVFSEPVTAFALENVNIVNARITNIVNKCDTTFVLTITPILPGPITIFVPANQVKALSTGLSNLVSNKLKIKALDPILHPSSNFDLSLWTLILPLPLGDIGNAITINSTTLNGFPSLNTGYINPPYFYTDVVTGAMNFFAPLNGATTINSVYPRSELSEYLPRFPHSWTLETYASNTLTASLLVSEVPPSKRILVGKIQDKGNSDASGTVVASKTLVKIYYDLNQLDPNGNACNGCIYARIRPVPAQDLFLKTVTLAKNTPLNKLFIYKIILLRDGTLNVKVNDVSTTYNLNTSTDNTMGWGTQELFFKAGVNILDNGASSSIGGQVSFRSIEIKHVLP